MNILLQNRGTLKYLTPMAGWTDDHDEARVFNTGLEAIVFCLNHRVANMQIIGKFVDKRLDFMVPVTDCEVGRGVPR